MKQRTSTRMGAVLLAVMMLLSLLSTTAMADNAVNYLDQYDTLQICENATPVTAETSAWASQDGEAAWYVVTGTVEITDRITVTGDVHLILADGCSLSATHGIYVGSGNSLTIYGQVDGSGILNAHGISGAGIGGNAGSGANSPVVAHGDITINGGTVTATGAPDAAGIGSGDFGVPSVPQGNGTITINGGTVDATGGMNGAGIGGGDTNNIDGGDIMITGGTVTAQGGPEAAGIGGGKSNNPSKPSLGRSITINGGTVTATGGAGAAGIGSGIGINTRSFKKIVINGSANVNATGGAGAAGIGGGYAVEMTGTILIGGQATVTAQGGGFSEKYPTYNTYGGAGIGGGGSFSGVGAITIAGGTVTATGGAGTSKNGAGIGSGGYGKYNTITVNAGLVTAISGGEGAAGIGTGTNGKDGQFSTTRGTTPGKAIIYADSISDCDDTSTWSGIVFQGDEGQVYGEISLPRNLVLKKGQTLTVPADVTLTIPENRRLTVQKGAQLIVEQDGRLALDGMLVNNGQFINNGELSGPGTITSSSQLDSSVAAYTNLEGVTKYFNTLPAAMSAASGNAGTVTLLKSAALSTSIEKDLTLAVAEDATLAVDTDVAVSGTLTVQGALTVTPESTITVDAGGAMHLPAMTMEAMGGSETTTGMKGDLVFQAGAQLTYGGTDVLGGSNPLLTLTEGNAALNLGNANDSTMPSVSLTLSGKATVDGTTKALLLATDNAGTRLPLAISVAAGSEVTVSNGGVLNLVNGSSLTVDADAAFAVAEQGIWEVHSAASFAGKATISGKVYVFESSENTNPLDGADLTLTSTGAVYAQTTTLEGTKIAASQMTPSEETYTSTSATEPTSFAYQWTHSFQITLDANGGILAGGINALQTNSAGNLTAMPEDPFYSGHYFDGWYDKAVGGTQVDINTTFTEDSTIYAHWTRKTTTSGGTSAPSYSITVKDTENGTVTVSRKTASRGMTVTIHVTPEDGYVLDTLTVKDASGTRVSVSRETDSQYIFQMPGSAVTVSATFAAMRDSLPFIDVEAGDWFYQAVQYAYNKGMMDGVGNNRFAPDANLTRAMIAQVLYNLEGTPVAGKGIFTDVDDNQWYADAVNWAAEKGIVSGYGDGTFGPEDNITREQMAQILYNYATFKGYDVSFQGKLTAFGDGTETSSWALSAMQWAVGANLLQGYNGNLRPNGTATRAEVAQIFMNFCENIAK